LYAESHFSLFPYPTPILAKISDVGVYADSEHPSLTNREIIFEEFQPM